MENYVIQKFKYVSTYLFKISYRYFCNTIFKNIFIHFINVFLSSKFIYGKLLWKIMLYKSLST